MHQSFFIKLLFYTSLFIIFFVNNEIKADSISDSCLVLKYPIDNEMFFNPDSVKIDTCLESPTFGQLYAKKFKMQFKKGVNIFDPNILLLDSSYTWEDINSNYPNIKSNLRDMELVFGQYYFKRHPHWIDDSSFIEVPTVVIVFDNYVCENNLLNFTQSTILNDSISYIELNISPVVNYSVPTDVAMVPRKRIEEVIWNIEPDDGKLNTIFQRNERAFHKLGYHWNLYNLKCPMAWEITEGGFTNNEKSVVIANTNSGSELTVPHPDMTNYLFINDIFDGNEMGIACTGGHDLQCLPQAIADIEGDEIIILRVGQHRKEIYR